MRRKSPVFLKILWSPMILTLLWAPGSYGVSSHPVDFSRGRWQVITQTSGFFATGNYSNDGFLTPLYQTDLFRTYHITGGLRVDTSSRLSLYSLMDFAYSESLSQNIGRRESNINELRLGSDYLFIRGRTLELLIRFEGVIPFLQYPLDTDDVFLGEGAYQFLSEFQLQGEMPWVLLYLRLGFLYRSQGLASLMPWGLGLRRDFGPVRLSAELYGFETAIDDQYAQSPTVRTVINERVNGGSYYYNAINPALMAFGVQLEYFWTQAFAISLAYNSTINGYRSAAGQELLFGMTFKAGDRQGVGSSPVRRQRGQHHNGFTPESLLDPTDQQLFDGTPDTTEEDLKNAEETMERRYRN